MSSWNNVGRIVAGLCAVGLVATPTVVAADAAAPTVPTAPTVSTASATAAAESAAVADIGPTTRWREEPNIA